jgi:hypothetical protein
VTNPTQVTQRTPYLRVQRNFPQESQPLSVELNKAYVDIANVVNARTIGIFPVNAPSVNGETWFINGEAGRQQGLRQVYTFTASGAIPHGILWNSVSFISPRSYGSYTDGTNWYGVVFSTPVPPVGQVNFYVTPTNIVVVADGAAPAITSGYIILEWVSVV